MNNNRERRRLEIFRRSPESNSTQGRSHRSDPTYNYQGQRSPESDGEPEDLDGLSIILVTGVLGYIGYRLAGGAGVAVGITVGLGINLWRGRSVIKDLFP